MDTRSAARKQPWRESETLDGRIGEFIVMRRTAADGTVLLGATTNEEGREITVPLGFLGTAAWKATVMQDAADTHFQKQRETYMIGKRDVTNEDTLKLRLAPGGGACVMFTR